MKIIDLKGVEARRVLDFLPKPAESCLSDLAPVAAIIENVKKNKDKALKEYTLAFDQVERSSIRVSAEEIQQALKQVPLPLQEVILKAKANIEAYHRHQIESDWSFSPQEGITLGQRIRPIKRVGLYIPGGKAAYPSTVLMNGIPARLAGVSSIVLFTPPTSEGSVNPMVLFAAHCLGITEIYAVGGAQAIAAAAYGTESIERVDKIVGPGNRYVAMAKKLVFGDVAIDMIAGPSEVLILADHTANPEWIAADLLAQAEHDEDAALYLVTDQSHLPLKVAHALDLQLSTLPKASIARKALSRNFLVLQTEDIAAGLAVANYIAPEHFELLVEDPMTALASVDQAGSVFVGPYTPEALGDYFAGTNHTLPTSGTARFSSPLGVYDFIKRPSFLSYSAEALLQVADQVALFANAEGLDAHARSITLRKEALCLEK